MVPDSPRGSSRWTDLGRGFLGLDLGFASPCSSRICCCLRRRYSCLMSSRRAFSSSFRIRSSSAFRLREKRVRTALPRGTCWARGRPSPSHASRLPGPRWGFGTGPREVRSPSGRRGGGDVTSPSPQARREPGYRASSRLSSTSASSCCLRTRASSALRCCFRRKAARFLASSSSAFCSSCKQRWRHAPGQGPQRTRHAFRPAAV